MITMIIRTQSTCGVSPSTKMITLYSKASPRRQKTCTSITTPYRWLCLSVFLKQDSIQHLIGLIAEQSPDSDEERHLWSFTRCKYTSSEVDVIDIEVQGRQGRGRDLYLTALARRESEPSTGSVDVTRSVQNALGSSGSESEWRRIDGTTIGKRCAKIGERAVDGLGDSRSRWRRYLWVAGRRRELIYRVTYLEGLGRNISWNYRVTERHVCSQVRILSSWYLAILQIGTK